MPKVSSLPRFSRNLAVCGRFAFDWLRAGGFRRRLAAAAGAVDVVHFNHEALFVLARWLRPRSKAAFVGHIRNNLWDTAFARRQNQILANTLDQLVFITENERATFERLVGLAEGTHGRGAVGGPRAVGRAGGRGPDGARPLERDPGALA